MSISDKMIRREMQAALKREEPAPDLWDRVRQALARRRRFARVRWAACLAVCMVVGLLLALPEPRAVAAGTIQVVLRSSFTAAHTLVIVTTGQQRGLIVEREVRTIVATQFQGEPGQFPPGARDAIRVLRLPCMVPGWLPKDMVVRAEIPMMSGSAELPVSCVFRLGNSMTIQQTTPVAAMENTGSEQIGPWAAESFRLNSGDLTYYFTVGNVRVTLSGPGAEAEQLKRIGASLGN